MALYIREAKKEEQKEKKRKKKTNPNHISMSASNPN